jgi:hypothetical protein
MILNLLSFYCYELQSFTESKPKKLETIGKVLKIVIVIPLLFMMAGCGDSNETPVGPDTGQGNSGDSRLFSSTSFPGASAEAYLTNTRFTDLYVEVDYMEGYEPTPVAINGLQSFLERYLNKTNITITLSEIPSTGGTYTLSQVRSLEEDHRDNYTEASGTTLYAYIMILSGEYFQENTLGIAFFNTSAALFGGTIESISGTPPLAPDREKVESTVINHEFGHLLGLVGSGSPIQSGHKTEGSPHCTTSGCLMEPSIDNTNFFANFSGEVPTLDDLCVTDLQANGGK